MSEKTYKILIAASGTGGHLFPALYIGEALKQNYNAEVLFIGSGRPLEEKIIGGAGFQREVVKIGGLKRLGIKGLISWLINLPSAILKTSKIISKFSPDCIIGVGGYVSVLPILIGKIRGKKTWIHEAEPKPGWANHFLSYVANVVSIAHKNSRVSGFAKKILTGHPVRKEFLTTDFSLDYKNLIPKNLLVLGGSQGSNTLDNLIIELAPELSKRNFEVTHQARPENIEKIKEAFNKVNLKNNVVNFIEDVPSELKNSHFIIARSGAGQVREILITGRPSILIPLPKAEEQALNAQLVKDAGHGIIVNEGTPDFYDNIRVSIDTITSSNYLKSLPSAPKKEDFDAAGNIAKNVIKLIENNPL